MSQILVGCDPEFFIHDGYEFYSAYGLLPGTKYEPHEVEDGTVQVDGLAVEIGIKPARNENEFTNRILNVLEQTNEMLKKVDKSFYLSCMPFVEFDKDMFEKLPLEAKILGCSPDWNLKGEQQTPPDGLQDKPFRTAAGHVHLGWTEGQDPCDPEFIQECIKISRSAAIGAEFKARTMFEKKRHKYYGGNSAFRPKHYGIELRAPSNMWLTKQERIRAMYRFVRNTMSLRGY